MKLKLKNTQVTGLSETQGYLIAPNNPVKIQAVPNSKVELFIDGVKQTGSELINGKPAQLKKVDKNLVLTVDGEPLVEINNFFDAEGVSLDGTGWQYTDSEGLSAQNGSLYPVPGAEIVPQALPLVAVAGAATGAGALALLGAIGLAAAAGGGGGTSPTTEAAALAKIEAYNNGNGTTPPALTIADYTAAGVTGVTADNLAAVNAQVLKQSAGGADTAEEIQALVAVSNVALAKIEAYNNGNGTTPPALTAADYAEAGIAGVTADNLAAVNAQVLGQAPGGAVTSPLIQALVTNVSSALTAIHDAAQNDSATSTKPSVATYTTAGVSGVNAGNLVVINSALDSTLVDGSKADTTAHVQTIVDAYNAILASADGAPGNTAVALTAAQYAAVGVSGVGTGNALTLLDNVIDGKASTAVSTAPAVQSSSDAANAVMTGAAAGTAPTLAQLALLGVTGVTAANLAAVQAAINATPDDGSGVNTLAKLQTVADNAITPVPPPPVNPLTEIHDAAQNDSATSTTPSTATYASAGVSGVTAGNLASINSALNSPLIDGSKADTVAHVQTIVDAYKAILASADGIGNNTSAPLTGDQYAAIGVSGISVGAPTAGSSLALLDSVVDASQQAAVGTESLLQAIATAAGHVMAATGGSAADASALTLADLSALGISAAGHTIADIRSALQVVASDASVDTQSKLQNIITNIPGNHPALSTNLSGVTDLDATSHLVFSSSSAVNVGTGLIHIKDNGGGTGFHNDAIDNSINIDVSSAIANSLLSFDSTHTKIIINPANDLDLSSNYSISIDAGAFVDQTTGALSQALSAVNFSTVTPGTHTVGGSISSDAHVSHMMDATGALQVSKSWIDLESYGTNTTQGLLQIGDLSTGSYALVLKNYATTPGGAAPGDGSEGIATHDVSVAVSNFGANDQLYFDTQVNNPAVQKFAPDYISAILQGGSITGGVLGQNVLNFGLTSGQQGSSAEVALGLEGNTANTIFQSIYAQTGLTDMTTNLHLIAPVVMG